MSCRHNFLVFLFFFCFLFFSEIFNIYPINPTLLCLNLAPTEVLFARTCESDVSKVNLPVSENSGFSKSYFVDVFFIL